MKEKIACVLWALFSLKLCKLFRLVQYKRLQVVKPCSNSDLYFILKTSSGRALLETIVSYKSPPSLSQENMKTLSPAPLDTSTTALMCIFSLILNYCYPNQKNSIMKVQWKVQVKRAFKIFFFLTKKAIK